MRKFFLSSIVVFILSFIVSRSSFAVTRFATCDACGLCPKINVQDNTCEVTTQTPGDWKNCVKCLYPTLFPTLYPTQDSPDPKTCDTMIIYEPPITPPNLQIPGRQFTMLGCISSGTSFTGQAGASTFVQVLLNVVFSLAGGLAFLYLMYGGFIVITSQADPERLNYGRRLIFGAIAGLIITLSSVFIVNIIGSGVLHIPGFGTP